MELKIVGRLTESLINSYKNMLDYTSNDNITDIIVFCDYSKFEIKRNHVFENIWINKTENVIKCSLVLKSISQEYMLPLESIPIGWKTICRFNVLDKEQIKLFQALPEINEWSESNSFFILLTYPEVE